MAAESLGGQLASPPTVVTWGEGEMEVFAVMADGETLEPLLGSHVLARLGVAGRVELDPSATPAASSWGRDRLDVFARGADGQTWHRWWDGTQWVPWEQLDR